jgi:hypothetical protein
MNSPNPRVTADDLSNTDKVYLYPVAAYMRPLLNTTFTTDRATSHQVQSLNSTVLCKSCYTSNTRIYFIPMYLLMLLLASIID